ncbi:alpha/beta hydrolase [Paractinoplanes abujensis]|uniref:Pimeloyl-ACP methyl ester carboxylesterase n=1 Tax=Paractinoplanes abujensis TaxID=882441 RepID=A0A7W7CR44_9ACTN|nr:alpha/beta hydrolase [Actinoplanes abujensis]MBB4692884.1 pimeloyl-ACP methyl ester carboxylesterase [Actinoplanes abujensis]GID22614.1 alpha/beta hydrolase [Actinoplanes abujensis]
MTPSAAVAVLELGSGEPVRVYVGGLGSATTVSFAGVAGHPALAGQGRHVLVDLVGSGWSDHDDSFGHSVDGHAATVAAVLDELGLRGVTLIGHSLGGSIAISLAAGRPELVGELIVAEPNLDPGVGTLSAEIAAFDEDTFAASGHGRLIRSQRTGDGGETAEFARTLARWSSRGLHRTAVSLLAERPATFREQLAAFAGPRRYISGELSYEELEPLRAAGCDVRVVPAAGHVLMWDNLDGFVKTLV